MRAVDFCGAELVVNGCVQIEPAAFRELHDCRCPMDLETEAIAKGVLGVARRPFSRSAQPQPRL